jgi:hypothetical protein
VKGRGSKKEKGFHRLSITSSPLPFQERGIKGVRLLQGQGEGEKAMLPLTLVSPTRGEKMITEKEGSIHGN